MREVFNSESCREREKIIAVMENDGNGFGREEIVKGEQMEVRTHA